MKNFLKNFSDGGYRHDKMSSSAEKTGSCSFGMLVYIITYRKENVNGLECPDAKHPALSARRATMIFARQKRKYKK